MHDRSIPASAIGSAGHIANPKEAAMPVTMTKFLRTVLYADILFSTGGALLMAAGAPFLSPLLGLPSTLLVGAGLVLIPWVLGLGVVVRLRHVPKIVMVDIVAINFLWCAACFGLFASGAIAPNGLGIAFVVAQALVVALFGVLQFLGLRDAAAAA
jgi:hypothetical protein